MWYVGFPGVKGALLQMPSALSGVSETLKEAGLRPWGEPGGEEQMPLWLLTILCVNTGQRPDPPEEETAGKCGWN